jgi:outer membrane protein
MIGRERSEFFEGPFEKERKVNSRTCRIATLVAVCLVSVATAWAQAPPAAGSAATGKVGVIDVRNAIVTTSEGKQAAAELQSRFAPRQNEIEGLNKSIADVRQQLEAGQGKINQEEQARLQREGELKARQLQRKQDEYQDEINSAQGEVFDRIGHKLVDVLDRYARENGYSVILDSSAQNSPILYRSTSVDVTQDIVRLYDSTYPMKGGSTASPATPPATQRPKPPPPKPQ